MNDIRHIVIHLHESPNPNPYIFSQLKTPQLIIKLLTDYHLSWLRQVYDVCYLILSMCTCFANEDSFP